MTYLLKDIRDHLIASTAIVNEFSDRVFDSTIPQALRDDLRRNRELYPCIVLSDISAEPEYYLGGESGKHTSQVQIDVWTDGTDGPQKCKELGELVRNRLSGYRGQFGTGCWGTSRMIRNNTVAAPPIDGSDTHRRRNSMDFEVIHSADVPTLT